MAYFGSSGSSGGYFTGGSSKKSSGGGLPAPFGFVGNLLGDVKDATIGFIPGMVKFAKDPIESVETMAEMTWDTWSPLFSGQFGKFAKGVYDHPLAPLLDVATVFSLGLDVMTAGAATPITASLIGQRAAMKLASTRVPRQVFHVDPKVTSVSKIAKTGGTKIDVSKIRNGQIPRIVDDVWQVPVAGRQAVPQTLSTRPMRRLMQEARLAGIEPHLPSWYKNARYNVKLRGKLSHGEVAKKERIGRSLAYVAALKAGEVLDDPKAWGAARQAVVANMHQGLDRHAAMTLFDKQKLPKGYAYVAKHDDVAKAVDKLTDPDEFEKFLANKLGSKSFNKVAITHDPAKAHRRADGSMAVVPVSVPKILGKEAARSSFFMRKLWRYPTTMWKTVTLGYAPRTVTNNAVGNWLIYTTRQNPSAAIAGIHDAIRITKGERAARRLGTPEAMMTTDSLWYNKHHLDDVTEGFGYAELGESVKRTMALKSGVYGIVHKTSDKPVRLASLASFYRRDKDVQRLMKDKRMTFDQAVDAVVAQNPEKRLMASDYARSIAGDYTTMTKAAETARDLMPFYLWNRHILKTVGNMTLDTPGRVAVYQRISNMGTNTVEEILGEVPDWLRGALPLELLGLAGGDAEAAKVITTTSLNPFATVGDLAIMAQALTVGDTPRPAAEVLGQMNPFLSGTVEALTGESLLTGAPKETYGGAIPTIGVNTFLGFPQVRLGKELISPDTENTPKGNPYLYKKDDLSALSSFLGIPIRTVNKERANTLAAG